MKTNSNSITNGTANISEHLHQPSHWREVLSWQAFNDSHIFGPGNLDPVIYWLSPFKTMRDNVFKSVVKSLRQSTKLFMGYSSVNYGYTMVNPLHGVNFMINMEAYIKGNSHHNTFDTTAFAVRRFGSLEFKEGSMSYEDDNRELTEKHEKVNFIVPLSGKTEALKRFLKQYEVLLTQNPNKLTLMFVLLCQDNPCNESVLAIKQTKNRFPSEGIRFIELNIEFNRAIALHKGISLFSKDDLLFFADVDLHITGDLLLRIHRNTIQHKQIYFPIMFSEFHPNMWRNTTEKYRENMENRENIEKNRENIEKNRKNIEKNRENTAKHSSLFRFDESQGYWRIFSLGPVAIYKSDYDFIGGFDLTIEGWGIEDRNLWERAVKKNITTFRSAEVALRHIYHDSHCDPNTAQDQYQMCLSSSALNYASTASLAQLFYSRLERLSDFQRILLAVL